MVPVSRPPRGEDMTTTNENPNYDAWGEKVKLENVKQWVRDYFESKGCSVTAAGQLMINGRRLENSKFLADMRLQYDFEYKQANRQLPKDDRVPTPSSAVLDAGIEILIDEQWWNFLEDLKENISYKQNTANNLQTLNKFIRACTGEEQKLQIHVMAHWIWQVKRKVFNKPVRNHLMPVFSGPQGSGKSTALNILTSPLRDYRLDWNLQALGDDRNYHGINRNFIILFDEMMGCNKTDIETLKHFITAERLSARKLYTNQVDSLAQNCSCLGTSNKQLDVLIRDETGMRRFVEIKSLDKMDWDILNSIDPLDLWREIDENNEHGYLGEVASLLRDEQENYRFQDSVENYLRETSAFDAARTTYVSNEVAFSDYVDWCREAEERPLTKQYFGKRLKSLGFESVRSSTERGYLLGSNFIQWRKRHANKIEERFLADADKLLGDE